MPDADLLSLGQWRWDSDALKLIISVEASSGFEGLNGAWTLSSIGHVLDGLSRRRLYDLLTDVPGREAAALCQLRLADGRTVRLVGSYEAGGGARGVLMRDIETSIDGRDDPGPDIDPVFQPILALESGEIAGFEALARWQDGKGQLSSPMDRLQDAGLASVMLVRACEALSGWQKTCANRLLFVNVNVTAQDLSKEGLPGLVKDLVEGHGFEPGQLRVELTEQAPLRDEDAALTAAKALKAAGAGLILDDFGSGHSSFAWLEALPADGLKVDSELIARLSSERMQAILASVTALAAQLGMSATAEGVERLEDVALIRRLGFGYAQGFAFARPLSGPDALALLKA